MQRPTDKSDTRQPTNRQIPPWIMAIPFIVFIVIVLVTYTFHREPLALVAIALATIMGIVWTYGTWRVQCEERRIASSTPPQLPRQGEGTVISRARLNNPLSQIGYLLATEKALTWIPRRSTDLGIGVIIPMTDLLPATTVARRDDIIGYSIYSSIFWGDIMTLELEQSSKRVYLLDPEGAANLLTLFRNEDNSNESTSDIASTGN